MKNPILRMFADAQMQKIYERTNETIRVIIARSLWES